MDDLKRVLGLVLLVVVFAIPEAPAVAQGIEEIVVTARKREESLQDVPLSISAFGEQFIDNTGVNSITDVALYTPNLSFRRSFGRAFDRPAIRGQGPILARSDCGSVRRWRLHRGHPFLDSAGQH